MEFGKKEVVKSEDGLIACSHVKEDNSANKTLAVPTVKKSILNKAPKKLPQIEVFTSAKMKEKYRALK